MRVNPTSGALTVSEVPLRLNFPVRSLLSALLVFSPDFDFQFEVFLLENTNSLSMFFAVKVALCQQSLQLLVLFLLVGKVFSENFYLFFELGVGLDNSLDVLDFSFEVGLEFMDLGCLLEELFLDGGLKGVHVLELGDEQFRCVGGEDASDLVLEVRLAHVTD